MPCRSTTTPSAWRSGNLVTGEGSQTCPPANPGDQCETTHPTPHYVLTKVSDPASGSTVQPGATVGYTVTATNDSDGVVTGAVVTDDLSDVLDNADLVDRCRRGLTLDGTTLTWAVPTIAVDTSVSVSYSVTVHADAFDQTIGNVVTPGPGGECVAPADCTTTHPTPHYVLTKVSNPATGSTVQPGATVAYTVTATNDSDGVVTGAVVTDDLSDVLDNADLVEPLPARVDPGRRPL